MSSGLAVRTKVSPPSVPPHLREKTSLRPDLIAELARVLDVSIAFLITGAEPNVRSKPGPKGQLEEAFEQAATLPRSEQKQVVNVVTALIAQYTNKDTHWVAFLPLSYHSPTTFLLRRLTTQGQYPIFLAFNTKGR